MFKVIVLLALLVAVISLFSGLYYLVRDRGSSERMAKALTWRIGLSVIVFMLLLAGYRFGWIPGAALGAHGDTAALAAAAAASPPGGLRSKKA